MPGGGNACAVPPQHIDRFFPGHQIVDIAGYVTVVDAHSDRESVSHDRDPLTTSVVKATWLRCTQANACGR